VKVFGPERRRCVGELQEDEAELGEIVGWDRHLILEADDLDVVEGGVHR